MKKVLVTGSNGLLGQKLVELYANREGIELIATGRGADRNGGSSHTYCTMDITSQEDINDVFGRFQPDAVINCAAMTQVDQCEEDREACWLQNVTAVKYLMEVCAQYNSFLLHLSTDFIFDGEAGPYEEDATPNPLSYYGESKLASEQLLVNSNIEWAIARTILVYGIVRDMSRSNIILWVKKSLEERKEIKVVNDQWRTPTLAEDLAIGCALIVDKKAQGVFNISGKDLLTPYEMALKTAEFFELDTATMMETDGSIFKQPASRPPKTGFILDKAREQLGYDPRSFEEGIAYLSEQLQVKG
ncbi:MAG: SDR family oxidoreductase [Cytophagales bacterium]|nr:SDR family oxidoreductase [Cytophagales bacterium]